MLIPFLNLNIQLKGHPDTIVAQDHVAEVKSRKKGQGFSIIDISKMSIYGCFWMLIQFLNIMIQLGL